MTKTKQIHANYHEADKWIEGLWLNKRVTQVVACEGFEHEIGRESVVVETFWDQRGQLHCKTQDGVWCPALRLRHVRMP